jgi:hypothetical protein
LGYSNIHKGFKCLDISGGRFYISLDVVLDKTVFPFAKLIPNADTCLHAENLLLSSSSTTQSSSSHGDQFQDIPRANVQFPPISTNVLPSCAAPSGKLEQNDAEFREIEIVQDRDINCAAPSTGAHVDPCDIPPLSKVS